MGYLDGYIYHMVHFDNLRNIFQRRALPRDAQRDCSKQAENDRRCLFVLTAGQREPRKKGGTSEEPSITSDKKHEIVGDRYENAQRDPLDERTYVEDELHRERSRLKRPANRGPGQTRVRAHRR